MQYSISIPKSDEFSSDCMIILYLDKIINNIFIKIGNICPMSMLPSETLIYSRFILAEGLVWCQIKKQVTWWNTSLLKTLWKTGSKVIQGKGMRDQKHQFRSGQYLNMQFKPIPNSLPPCLIDTWCN